MGAPERCWFTRGWMFFGHIATAAFTFAAQAGGIRQISDDVPTLAGFSEMANQRTQARTHHVAMCSRRLRRGTIVDPRSARRLRERRSFLLCTMVWGWTLQPPI